MRNNPMSGGPDCVEMLVGAIEQGHANYCRPPATGGRQFSVRLSRDRLELLDLLADRSGWNRNQIVDGLIDKGFFILFERLSGSTGESLTDELVQRLTSKQPHEG